ncbi:MAG: hypothetical protein ACHQ50_10335 [Fimbriimonadales bacterium]
MRRILSIAVIALGCWQGAFAIGQQGDLQGIYQGNSLREVENRLSMYLNGDMIKSILTPGEFCEWKLDLKAGQVLIAEASAENIDTVIEVVDQTGKSVAFNDDRYPGDQRPLLLWRCLQDGPYLLHVRCLNNKAGGQIFVRFKTYETLDLSSGQKKKAFDATKPFLVRAPMKAGQVKDFVAENMGQGNYLNYRFNTVIFPNGLPEKSPSLSEPLYPAIVALVAPLDGDYYLMYSPFGYVGGDGWVSMRARDIVPEKVVREGSVATAKASTNIPALWEISVKAGEFIEVSMPDLSRTCSITLSEAPDFSRYAIDTKKPEMNPFNPLLRNLPPTPGPAFDYLPKRIWDNRIMAFRARRDAKLWLASNGAGPADKQFTLRVRPAAADFAEDKTNTGKLRIADTDYWAFDAKAGDVLNLDTATAGFYETIVVRDPDLAEIRHADSAAAFDQTPNDWRMVVQKPGRYLVAVSCFGNGGGGEYSLSRKVLHAKEFGMSAPAKGEISDGQIQVWEFKATPSDPLLIHWNSTNWSYDIAVYDDKGQRTDFEHQILDDHNRFGILKVNQPQTFVIVLTGIKETASYSIELNGVPGFKPAPKEVHK